MFSFAATFKQSFPSAIPKFVVEIMPFTQRKISDLKRNVIRQLHSLWNNYRGK